MELSTKQKWVLLLPVALILSTVLVSTIAAQYFSRPGAFLICFLFYWIVLEYKTGQSIGKKILHLKVTNLDGKHPSLLGVTISSFGKAFLLPIDFILGLIFTNQKRQRIFNKIGDTIVLKIKDNENNSENIRYKKD